MHDEHRSAHARQAARRLRRRVRRARAFAPVLAVPAIFGLLALTMNLIEYRPARRPAPDARSETARASMTGLREPAAEALAVDDVRPPDAIAASVIDGVLATGVTAGSDWLESASRAQDDALDPARAALRDPAPAAVDRRP